MKLVCLMSPFGVGIVHFYHYHLTKNYKLNDKLFYKLQRFVNFIYREINLKNLCFSDS